MSLLLLGRVINFSFFNLSVVLRVLVLMHPHYLQYWWVLFLLPFLAHIVYLCHLSDIRLCSSSSPFVDQGPLVRVPHLSILAMFPNIWQVRHPKSLSLWWDFGGRVLSQEVFSFIWAILSFLFVFLSFFFSFVSTCLLVSGSNIPKYF